MKKIWIFFFTVFAISQALCQPINWSAPVTLSVTATNATDPQIVIDLNGNATAAWVENGVVNTCSQPVGGSWGPVTTLSGSGALSPRLVVDTAGNVNAIWAEASVIKSASMPFGSAWGSATSISDVGASQPALGVDSLTGNIVAVWARSSYIESATKLFGSAWGSSVSLLSNSGSDHPQVGVNNNIVVAVWHTAGSGTNASVASATATVGGAWNTAQTLSPAPLNHVFPTVAVDKNGNAQVIWYQYNLLDVVNYNNVTVLASSLIAGSSVWTAPVALSSPGNYDPAKLTGRIAFDGSGNAMAFWSNVYPNNLFNLESSILPLGGEWQQSSQLTGDNLYAYEGDIAINSYGDAVAVFMVNDAMSSVSIQYSETNIAGVSNPFWSGNITVSEGTKNGFPRVASTLNGTTVNAATVWISNNGTNNAILASTGSKTILLPPSSPTVVQAVNDFGVLQEYYNTVSWTASSDPSTVAYKVYRNGSFFQLVELGLVSIVDDNQVQNGAVTYGIAAIDAEHSQSEIINVSFP
ncbi:MAG TPA: hypothetical protein VHK67_05145 [Rhabdochlamydiaceae bacterium]|jgi:hypothetical protein|nr:hypothetical protein [Rhabdochlamydiaceae bacterium]